MSSMMYQLGNKDLSDEQKEKRIVDVEDKLPTYKHILMTEKYNFNMIKWKKYSHANTSGADLTTADIQEDKEIGLKYPKDSKNTKLEKFVNLTMPYLQTWHIPLAMNTASVVSGTEQDSNRNPLFSYNIIKEAYSNIVVNWYELQNCKITTSYETYDEVSKHDVVSIEVVEYPIPKLESDSRGITRAVRDSSGNIVYSGNYQTYILGKQKLNTVVDATNKIDTSTIDGRAGSTKTPMSEEFVSKEEEVSPTYYVSKAETFDIKIINEFNYQAYSDNDIALRKNPDSKIETEKQIFKVSIANENKSDRVLSNISNVYNSTASQIMATLPQSNYTVENAQGGGTVMQTTIAGATVYGSRKIYTVNLNGYTDYENCLLHTVVRTWTDKLRQTSTLKEKYTLDDLIAYNQSDDRKEKVDPSDFCGGAVSYESSNSSNASSISDLSAVSGNQVIVVEASSSNAIVKCYEKNGNKWEEKISTNGWVGSNGAVSADKMSEGGYASPQGLYDLGTGFGIKSKPSGVTYDYRKVTNLSNFVDDPNSDYYNQWVEENSNGRWNSAEHLIDYSGAYDYGVVINYNMNPIVKGKGSAIFLHCGSGPTAGCVAVPTNKMIEILKWLNKSKNPQILITDKTVDINSTSNNTNSGNSSIKYNSVSDEAIKLVNEIGNNKVIYDSPWSGGKNFRTSRLVCSSFCGAVICNATNGSINLGDNSLNVHILGQQLIADTNNFELIYYKTGAPSTPDISGNVNTDKKVEDIIKPGDIVAQMSSSYTYQHALIYIGNNEFAEMNSPGNVSIRPNFSNKYGNIKYIFRLKNAGQPTLSSSSPIKNIASCNSRDANYYKNLQNTDGLNRIDFMNSNPEIYKRYLRKNAPYMDYVGYSRAKLNLSYWNLKDLFREVESENGSLPWAYGETLGFEDTFNNKSSAINSGNGQGVQAMVEKAKELAAANNNQGLWHYCQGDAAGASHPNRRFIFKTLDELQSYIDIGESAGTDCSAFVLSMYLTFTGVNIDPGGGGASLRSYAESHNGQSLPDNPNVTIHYHNGIDANIQPGDVLFGPGHVGLYVGNDSQVDQGGGGVGGLCNIGMGWTGPKLAPLLYRNYTGYIHYEGLPSTTTTGGTGVASGEFLMKSGYEVDKNYKGTTYSLTDAERKELEWIVYNENSINGYEGMVLVAQCLRDALTNGHASSPMTIKDDMRYSYGEYRTPKSSISSEDAKNAIKYVFDEGGSAVQHRIYVFYATYITSAWHESQHFIIEHGNTGYHMRYFDYWD